MFGFAFCSFGIYFWSMEANFSFDSELFGEAIKCYSKAIEVNRQLRCIKLVLVSNKMGKKTARLIYNSKAAVISWRVKTLKAQNLSMASQCSQHKFQTPRPSFQGTPQCDHSSPFQSCSPCTISSLGKLSPLLLPIYMPWCFLTCTQLFTLLWITLYVHVVCFCIQYNAQHCT